MKHSGLLLGVLLLTAAGISCSMDGGSGGSATGGSPTVASPVFSLSSGTYYNIQFLTISSSVDGAVIHYTTDGSTPTASSLVYSSCRPVKIKKTESIKAVAVKDGVSSAAATAAYVIDCLYTDSSLCNNAPGYWNNGKRITLPLPDGAVKAVTLQCYASDNGDIVVDGYFYDSNGDTYPCYWDNSTCCKLDVSETGSWGRPNYNVIVFTGNDIYIAGWECAASFSSGSTEIPCYWKNTGCTELSVPSGADQGETSSISISETGSIYITGTLYTSDGAKPCYWKDGKCKILSFPSGYINGRTENCSLLGDDVYILGGIYNSAVNSKPCYWKNDEYHSLEAPDLSGSDGQTGYRCGSVLIDGSDTYVSGYSYVCSTSNDYAWIMSPLYWKNGNLVTLSLPACSAENQSGGVWWFEKAGDVVVMHGSWSDSDEYADCYWWEGTYDGVTYSKNGGSGTNVSGAADLYTGGFCKDSSGIMHAGYWTDRSVDGTDE